MTKTELKTAVAAVLALEPKELEAKVSELLETAAKTEADTAKLVAKTEADTAKLTEENEGLKAHLEKLKLNPNEIKRYPKTFKVGGKEYQFKPGVQEVIVPSRILKDKTKSGTLTVEQVVNDKEVRDSLVEIGFGGIEEVSAKK